VNSRTFKDLWNEIQVPSSTYPVSKYFQDLEFIRKKIQGLSRMCGTLYVTHGKFCGWDITEGLSTSRSWDRERHTLLSH